MEQGETVLRKELRKQKLMEYLATKGKQKLTNPNSSHFDYPVKKPLAALTAVMGKENKVPAQGVGYEASKVKPLSVYCTKIPTRGVFSDSNKGNATRGIHDKQRNEKQNSVLRSTYTVISSKPNPTAPTYFKKQPNTGKPFSAKVSSNVGRTAVSASHSRFNSGSNMTLSGPMNVRISLGPLVKTKTGLIPAVTHPRNTNSHSMHTSATAPGNIVTTNSVAKKAACCPLSVSQRSSMAQKKVISTTFATNPVHVRSAVSMSARFRKNEDLSKSNLKPLLVKRSQPSCKSQISRELKSPPLFSQCESATIKPRWKAGMSKTNQSDGQNTGRSTKQKSEDKEKINNRLSKVTQKSLEPSTRSTSRAVSGAAVAGMAAKTMACKEAQSKSGRSAADMISHPMDKKRDVKVLSKTVPQPTRVDELKTPKVPVRAMPQTEGKKLSAAQEERIKKLQEWREAKGISYKRPPMPVKARVRRTVAVPQPFWTAMKEEDEAHSLIQAVDRALADCIKLLEEGCPLEQVKRVLSRLPAVSQKFAKYWICQARLMEQEGNLDVLPMFKEAVHVVLEPVDELRTVVFEILKKRDETQEKEKDQDQMPAYESPDESSNKPTRTPDPVRALINGEKGDSSVVKFKITATPGGPLNRPRGPVRVDGQEVRFFTPVRRSVRIERASSRYPASLQDHDLCVASYNDLISKEENEDRGEQSDGNISPSVDNAPMYIYRQNEALEDKVSVQLVYDEVI